MDEPDYRAFDLLPTMVALVAPDGDCRVANTSFETVTGIARRNLQRGNLLDWIADAQALRDTLAAVARNDFATARIDAVLKRASGLQPELLPVHVIVNQTDDDGELLVELIEIEQQTRQDRDERAHDQVEANKELIRNLAHEIKNPLGGIRGAAQLLEMELPGRELAEYTQVIIQEADRLQALVDRLLAPHKRAHVVGDVNIHEVCERVRSLVLAEFGSGRLQIERDYDISIPEFRGDREQLIQAVLNIVRNAAQALHPALPGPRAQAPRITLRTRIARQVTLGKTRWRLALELHVEDNGPGIPEALRDRIFYPLVSGRDGGTGLGLTLAQTFVQQHMGLIECMSDPGRTVFKIVIPLP
jgi:two-component system nitrogen regulation sensor histidine kinase GlnL